MKSLFNCVEEAEIGNKDQEPRARETKTAMQMHTTSDGSGGGVDGRALGDEVLGAAEPAPGCASQSPRVSHLASSNTYCSEEDRG